MRRIFGTCVMGAAALALVSCGDDVSPDPVEQIVVAEQGETARFTASAVQGSGASGDLVEIGRAAFDACSSCHSVDPSEASSIGPNLAGVVGRAAGGRDDYQYSEALTGSGLTWDEANLDAFLTAPETKIPGTKMLAGAVSDADKRAAIIAYLAAPTR